MYTVAVRTIKVLRFVLYGVFLVLMLWDWFILYQDRGYYFFVFAFANLLYLVEDTIRYRYKIPYKDCELMTERVYQRQVWWHCRRIIAWSAAAAFHLYYLRTHSALPFV